MVFNITKCKVLYTGNNNPNHKYEMRGIELEVAVQEKDLGVWYDASLKPAVHCEMAAKKANAMLGQILRAFHFRKKATLVKLFIVFVRPILEFAEAAWSPYTEKDAETLEKVQKRLIRSLSDVRGESYEDKLRDAGLTSLKERRRRGDLIEAFKAMKGISKVDRSHWFQIQPNTARSTRMNMAFAEDNKAYRRESIYKQHANLELRKNFFTLRVTDEWNRLPDAIRNAKSVNAFKNSLDRWHKAEEEIGGNSHNGDDQTNDN